MSEKKKVLWFGDGPTVTTGYGKVAHNILMGLHDLDKYEIISLGINYLGDPHNLPITVFPVRSHDPYGRGRLMPIIKATRPDVIIINNDIWAMQWMMPIIYECRKWLDKDIPVIGYFPIDGTPVKKEWVKFIKNSIDYPITYTQWAADQINKVDKSVKLDYIYHGVDTDLYAPNPEAKLYYKQELSRQAGVNIDFVIGYVGRNQPRKRLPELMIAYNMFAQQADNTMLYLHTPNIDAGWNLKEVKNNLCLNDGMITIAPKLHPAEGLPEDRLAAWYQAFDVLVLPTVGEGFGLPLIEGMASGCAVVSTDCSVVPEIVGDAGILVKPGSFEVMVNDNELLRPIPSIAGLRDAFRRLHSAPEYLAELSNKSIERAKEFSTWHIDKWDAVIQEALTRDATPSSLDFDLSLLEE